MEALLLIAAAGSAAAAAGPKSWLGEAPAPLAAERLARNALRRALELLRRLGASRAAGALLGMPGWQELTDEAASRAERAGARLEPGDAAAAVVVAAVCGGAMVSVLFDTWLMLPLALVALFVGTPALSARHAELRRREANAAMPAVFRTLSVAMGAGMTLVQAAEYAGARAGGAVGEAFARLALRLRCGVATEAALGELSGELRAPGAGLLSTALAISHRTGSPLQGLFQRSAALVERQGEFERLLAVKTAQVRLSVRVVCLLPAVMVALLAAISPDFQKGLSTPAGAGSVALAALLDVAAVAIIRRLIGKVL
mgnify:FL=1